MRIFDFLFYHSPLGPIGIAMHLFFVELPRVLALLINNPPKKRRQHVSDWYHFRTGVMRVLILPHV